MNSAEAGALSCPLCVAGPVSVSVRVVQPRPVYVQTYEIRTRYEDAGEIGGLYCM